MRHARVSLAPLGFVTLLAACTTARVPSDPPKTAETLPERSSMLASSLELRPEPRGSGADNVPRETTETRTTAVSTPSSGNDATTTLASPQNVATRDGAAASESGRHAVRDVASPEATAPLDLAVTEEPIYFPGARPKPKGTAVDASLDDEIVATWNRGGLGTDADVGPKGKPPHAAPRVKVDVVEVRGSASEAEMQRAARLKSYWPFRICYEQGLRRTQKLHGTIKLRLTIGSSGRPSNVQPIATELGDPEVVACVAKSAAGLALPAPAGGAPQVTLAISLWPGDAPVSAKSPRHGKNALPADTAALSESLRTRTNEIRTCYAAGVRRHERLWGRLALSLKVAKGAVREADEVESHFPDPEVTACVRQAVLGSSIPSAGSDLVVVYALRFGHAPDARDARH